MLIAVATTIAYLYSVGALITNIVTGLDYALFFDSGPLLLLFITLGKLLEHLAKVHLHIVHVHIHVYKILIHAMYMHIDKVCLIFNVSFFVSKGSDYKCAVQAAFTSTIRSYAAYL